MVALSVVAHPHQVHLHLHGMIGAMDVQHSLGNHVRRAIRLRHLAAQMLRVKEDGWIALAFQHLVLHLLVARGIAGVAGCGVHQQFSLSEG